MKRLPFLILIAASILVCGCHRHDAFFQSVEDLIDSAPDSALALAEAFEPFGRAEKARSALLIAKAKNKAYIDTSADSLIETAVDHYRGNNDSLEVQALYYSAARQHSLADFEQALYRLTIAEEKADQINDIFYLAMIQRLASDCYNELYVMNRAEEYAIKACNNFRLAGKDNHAKWCELIVATALSNNHHTDSAISVLLNNPDNSSPDYNAEWHNVMGQVQYLAGNYNDVIKNYEILKEEAQLECDNYIKLSDSYINTNNISKAIENLDSAMVRCRTWSDSIHIDIVRSKILEAQGNIEQAFAIYKKSDRQLYEQYDKLLTHPYYNLIDKNLKVRNKQYVRQAKVEKKLRLFATTLIFLTIIIATTIIMVIQKDNKTKKYRISLLMAQAGELKSELNLLNENNEKANNETQSMLDNHIHLLNNICSEWYLLPDSKKTDKLFGKKIGNVLSEINSDEALENFETLINRYHDNIIERICNACPKLTKENKRILIYLSLGLSYDSICFLISKSKSTFAVYRHRLKRTIEDSDLEHKEDVIKRLFRYQSDK